MKIKKSTVTIIILSVLAVVLIFAGVLTKHIVDTKFTFYPTLSEAIEHSDTVIKKGISKKYYRENEPFEMAKTSYGYACAYYSCKNNDKERAYIVVAKVVITDEGFKAVSEDAEKFFYPTNDEDKDELPDFVMDEDKSVQLVRTDTSNKAKIDDICKKKNLAYKTLDDNLIMVYRISE